MNATCSTEQVLCVCCQGESILFLLKNGISIWRCLTCGHIFAQAGPQPRHVGSVYGRDYFFGGGGGYPDYMGEARLLEARGRRYARRVRDRVQPGKLLDVGAAAGFIMKGFAQEGWACTGVEPNSEMVRYAREALGQNVIQGTLETCGLDQAFDLVTVIQVIAHLHDLPRALTNLRRLVRPGGALLIETWNQQSLTARLSGKYWHEYNPPSVLHWFTPDRLATLLGTYGFTRVAQGRMLKWISLQHAISSVSHVLGRHPAAIARERLFSAVSIPYPSEDLFWALYT